MPQRFRIKTEVRENDGVEEKPVHIDGRIDVVNEQERIVYQELYMRDQATQTTKKVYISNGEWIIEDLA